MITIAATLDQEQFKNAFGNEDLVKKLSNDAVTECLRALNILQAGEPPQKLDWRIVFSDAVELTPAKLIENHKKELMHYDDHFMSLAKTIVFNNDIDKIINDEERESNYMIIKGNIDTMLKNDEFIKGAAQIVGCDNHYTSLDNGLWFKLI